jgi:hypothetical protein
MLPLERIGDFASEERPVALLELSDPVKWCQQGSGRLIAARWRTHLTWFEIDRPPRACLGICFSPTPLNSGPYVG